MKTYVHVWQQSAVVDLYNWDNFVLCEVRGKVEERFDDEKTP